jgi:hypothetical protein
LAALKLAIPILLLYWVARWLMSGRAEDTPPTADTA